MERLSNCVSAVIQLWKTVNLRNSEDGDNTFSETSFRTSSTGYKVPESIFNYSTSFLSMLQSSLVGAR
jgi:hypothetical protein